MDGDLVPFCVFGFGGGYINAPVLTLVASTKESRVQLYKTPLPSLELGSNVHIGSCVKILSVTHKTIVKQTDRRIPWIKQMCTLKNWRNFGDHITSQTHFVFPIY